MCGCLLRCSIGNSKSQLHKAKLKMRDLLFPKKKGMPRPEAGHRAEVSAISRAKNNRMCELSLYYGAASKS